MYRASKILHLKRWWLAHRWVGTLLLFFLAGTLFSVWLPTDSFRDPDAFYHLQLSQMLLESHSATTYFFWLPHTTLATGYVDHHFLYHVFVAPFIWLVGPYTGIKITTLLLAASVIALFNSTLNRLHVAYAPAWSLLLLFSHQLAFRIGLSKAPSVSIVLLLLGFLLLANRRWRAVTILSFLYVWSYGGFPLMVVLAALMSGIRLLQSLFGNETPQNIRGLRQDAGWGLFSTLLGIGGGLLINPAFPQHLHFYWQQIVQIGVVNYSSTIGVGGEWYPTPLHTLLLDAPLISLFFGATLIALIITWQKQDAVSRTAAFFALFFFILTLKSQRYVEYYAPWAVLSSALVLYTAGMQQKLYAFVRALKSNIDTGGLPRIVTTLACIYGLVIVGLIGWSNHQTVSEKLRTHPIEFNRYAAEAEWLETNAAPGSIIFHSDWDDFPMLFHHAPSMRYISGLDPTFLYKANQDLYWKWVDITLGRYDGNYRETIADDFSAEYILVEQNHTAMMNAIASRPGFSLEYTGPTATIFSLTETE